MRIRWKNILLLLMLVVAVALMATRPQSPVGIFLRSMAHVGPAYSDDEQLLGFIAWLLVTVLFIVVLRRLLKPRDH